MKTITLLGGKLIFTDEPPRPPEDALWLAATMPLLAYSAQVLDAGCGSGIAGLALLHHQPSLKLTALDVDANLTTRAQQHAQLNQREVTTVTADVLNYTLTQNFAAIICNPPFHAATRGHQSDSKGLAKTLTDGMLTAWLQAFARMLTADGVIHLIVHTACEDEIAAFAQTENFTFTITPLITQKERPAKRLIATLKRGNFKITHHPEIAAYDEQLRARVLKNAERLT